MRKLLTSLGLTLLLLSSTGNACMRLVPRDPAKRPDMDGPASFGPLQDTLTLDCLRFVAVAKEKGSLLAVLVDEKGREYRVGLGHWIGENSGKITAITETRISLTQIVMGPDGEYVEVLRYLFRDKGS
jgi:Tfp pilus assembly protein PilP